MEELKSFVEKYHPNKNVASCVCNIFNDHALSHFRQILKMPEIDLSGQIYFEIGVQ